MTYEVTKTALGVGLSRDHCGFDNPETNRYTNGVDSIGNHEINIGLGDEGVPVVGKSDICRTLAQPCDETVLIVHACSAIAAEPVTTLECIVSPLNIVDIKKHVFEEKRTYHSMPFVDGHIRF